MSSKAVILCSASFATIAALAAAPAAAQTEPIVTVPASTADEEAQEGEIIVRGVRASLARALEIKRESTQIVESVVAEDIGKLPDNNVVEALQRVTGIQVTNRSGGEAAAISIRGLPDITTTWNGRNIFTASGRSFALADIPANLVRRIDVYKTRAADQIETGIAGQVDVFTRRPLDFDGFAFSTSIRGIYHEQADKINPNVSALLSNRWETGAGDFGALINVSFSQTKYRDQSVTAGALVPFATAGNPPAGWAPLERIQPTDARAPGQQIWEPGLERGLPTAAGSTFLINGVQTPYLLSRDAVFASDLTGNRKRPAVNVALQWAPNPSSEYTFEFFYDGFRNVTFNDLAFTFIDWHGNLGADPASTVSLYDGTNLIKSRTVGAPFQFNSGDFTKQKTDSFVYALGGKWDVGDKLKLNADLSYQTSKFNTEFLAMRTTRIANSVTVDLNSGGGLTAYQFDDNALLADPAQWTVGELYDNANRNKGDAYTVTVDGDYDADWGILKKISFGVRYDDRGASEAQRIQDAPALGRPFTSFDSGLQYYNKDFFDNRSDVPSSWVVANGYYLHEHADEIRDIYRNSVDSGIQLSNELAVRKTFDIQERTAAAYIQADFEQEVFGRPLRVQAGVRYVNVKTDMDFIDFQTGALSAAKKKVDDFLPSVTVRYDVTDDLRLRFNFGKTLRRPNFVDLNPNVNFFDDVTNVGYGSGNGGNPDLRPTKATNFDVALEWYFQNDSAIYATLFRREIDGLVIPFRRVVNADIPGNIADQYIINSPVNASDGVLKGAEIGLVYFPKGLPGLLDGIGVQGSLTVLDSSQNIPIPDDAGNIVGEEKSSFFGVSKLSYNVTLAYEHGPIGTRLSYVWRKNFLNNNEARLFANPLGIWRKPEKSLDFQLNYAVTDRLSLSIDAVNLTDELSQSYYRFADAGSPDTTNFGSTILSRTFAFGLRYSFD